MRTDVGAHTADSRNVILKLDGKVVYDGAHGLDGFKKQAIAGIEFECKRELGRNAEGRFDNVRIRGRLLNEPKAAHSVLCCQVRHPTQRARLPAIVLRLEIQTRADASRVHLA